MKDLAEIPWLEVGDDEDGRDYIEFARVIDQSIRGNLTDASGPHREGYLRTLADFLSMAVDGGLPAESNWDPIENTAAAYARKVQRAGALNKGEGHE